MRLPLALALYIFAGTASAATQADLNAALDHKQDALDEFKLSLETAAVDINTGTFDNSTCEIYSSCSAELSEPFCHFNYGNSRGCGCNAGRTIDTRNSVIKTSPNLGASDYSVKRTACEANHINANLTSLYDSMIELGDAKWLFYGSKDGVLINFPGIVWDEDIAEDTCGTTYDARIRPWHMTGATGPKNVVLILDTSGSMSNYNRIDMLKQAAKAVLDATTFADFIGIVEFNSYASTYADLTTLARAMPEFKEILFGFIDGFSPGGSTNMLDGFKRAFKLVDDSNEKNYGAGCHTTYVLVTDGKWAGEGNPTSTIVDRQITHSDEHFFVVGLGDDKEVFVGLKDLSCKTGAIYTQTNDGDESGLQRAMISFYKYYALFKTLNKVEGYSWSEPYESIPSIWGAMTTVVAPVYDKTREPWHMMGVAGVDATVCDLLQNKVPDPTGSTRTQRGCTCRETYTYHGNMLSGCTTTDWPVPWCATSGICGSCNTDSVEGGCWDDCEPEGKEGVLQEELLARSTGWCEPASLDACALEALRLSMGEYKPESKCGSSESKFDYASCTDANIANYSWAIDGPQDPDSTTYNLKSVQSSLQGTLYDMNADECECDDTMQPTCACAAMVEINKRSKTCSGGDCSHLNMGLLFGILIPCLLCCFGFIWKIICRKKRVPPQVQVTHHVIHSNGPSVPGMPASYAFQPQQWAPAQATAPPQRYTYQPATASPQGHIYPASPQPYYPKV